MVWEEISNHPKGKQGYVLKIRKLSSYKFPMKKVSNLHKSKSEILNIWSLSKHLKVYYCSIPYKC